MIAIDHHFLNFVGLRTPFSSDTTDFYQAYQSTDGKVAFSTSSSTSLHSNALLFILSFVFARTNDSRSDVKLFADLFIFEDLENFTRQTYIAEKIHLH